jgi:hypothetical protein
MALDVCYTLNQFCGPLPEHYEEFKSMVSTFLPNIVDTKVRILPLSYPNYYRTVLFFFWLELNRHLPSQPSAKFNFFNFFLIV